MLLLFIPHVHWTTRELIEISEPAKYLSANSSCRTKSIFHRSATSIGLCISHLWHTMNVTVFVNAIRISINIPKSNSKNRLNNRNHVKCKMNENIRAWVAYSVIMVDDIVLRFIGVVTSFISSVSISHSSLPSLPKSFQINQLHTFYY